MNAVQSTMFALCAHVSPTNVRPTRIASALWAGRTGAVVSSFCCRCSNDTSGLVGLPDDVTTAMLFVLAALASVEALPVQVSAGTRIEYLTTCLGIAGGHGVTSNGN